MINLSAAPPGGAGAARPRHQPSSNELTTMLSGRLQAAAQSVGNLSALGGEHNDAFYERISSRLNEVLSEIDNEIFASGEHVLGASNGRCQERGEVLMQDTVRDQDLSQNVAASAGLETTSHPLSVGRVGRVRRYFQFYGC